MSNRKKILIIGGTGFIGRNLLHYFKNHTSYDVAAPTRSELNLLDDTACKNYIKYLKPDYVVHCAVNIASVEDSLKIFFNIYNQRDNFGHLIQLGSGAEYDKRVYVPGMTEEYFGRSIPIDTYGISKYLIARELNSSSQKNVNNFRLFGIFGRFEDFHRRFISNNICRALVGLPTSLNRDMLFDYIHVDDLAKLLVQLFDKFPLRSIDYNFCSGAPVSLRDIGELISGEMGQKKGLLVKMEGSNPEYSGSPSKLFSEIGEFQFTPIRESIVDLIKFYRQELDLDEFRKLALKL